MNEDMNTFFISQILVPFLVAVIVVVIMNWLWV